MQKNVGWTNGKNPVQVHIPARYLNVGKNVIATYIQQNWGGRFYDCGINVEEVNYDESVKQFNDAVDYAKTDTLLTNRMHSDVQAIIDQAWVDFDENKNDPAEIKNYAKELVKDVNVIGNGPEALAGIVAVGNDPKVDEGSWTCGKEQSVPVSCGIPTVLVKNLTVGGE